ncbi:MAG: hypothetical protein MJ101_05210 [Clostridia bacterium]|nr:hypothetical protein [Clostridia bacterium]
MANKKVMFRNALSGYNKEDVNTYLAAVSTEMLSKTEMYEMRIERETRRASVAEDEKAQISAQLDELAVELFGVQASLTQKDAENVELKNAIMGMSARIDELEKSLAEKTEELNKIESLVASVDQDGDGDSEISLEQEAALFEKLNDRISRIIMSANTSAEDCVTNAMNRGDDIIADARLEAQRIIDDAKKESDELKEKYRKNAAEYAEEVVLFVSEIKSGLDSFLRDIGSKSLELGNRIEYMNSGISDNYKPQINGEYREKPEVKPTSSAPKKAEPTAKPTQNTQSGKKTKYTSFDEKIEQFFKSTMAAINAFKNGTDKN